MSEKFRYDLVFYRSEENDSVQKKVETIEAETIDGAKKIATQKMLTEYPHANLVEIFKGGMSFEYGYFYGEISRWEILNGRKDV